LPRSSRLVVRKHLTCSIYDADGYPDTVALVNYIGSTGYGQDFVEALRGGAGDLDVEDCMSAVRHLVKLGIAAEGPGKQYIIGQSHGGFIAAHREPTTSLLSRIN